MAFAKQAIIGTGLLAMHMLPGSIAQGSVSADGAVGAGPGTVMSSPFAANNARDDLADPGEAPKELLRQDLNAISLFSRTCDCIRRANDELEPENIRAISDEFAADGNAASSFGLSNMVWSFGQFIDHDLALGIEDVQFGVPFPIGSQEGEFEAEREIASFRRGCPSALNVHTGQIDAGMVYGTDADLDFLNKILRIPGSCNLRISKTDAGEFPPVTTTADAQGRFFFLAGDTRISEHTFLFAQHTVWLREHNRLCTAARANPATSGLSEQALFDLVQNVVIAKLQQVVLTEFLPSLGITQTDLETAQRVINTPDTSTEFSMAYRMGHDLVPNYVGDLSVTDLFQSEKVFLDVIGAGGPNPTVTFDVEKGGDALLDKLVSSLAGSLANELDGLISDALRNTLFGLSTPENPMGGQDLVGRNIFRSREVNLPTYAGLAECFGITPDAQTELETPDAWIGLVREPRIAGNVFGPTQRAIIVEQFHRSFFGPGGRFWRSDTAALGPFLEEVEASTYATIFNANTNANVAGDVFFA